MNPYLSLLVAFVLLAANAFYVAAEFALVKARAFRIDTFAEENKFGALLTQKILRNIEAYLACCQLGINAQTWDNRTGLAGFRPLAHARS